MSEDVAGGLCRAVGGRWQPLGADTFAAALEQGGALRLTAPGEAELDALRARFGLDALQIEDLRNPAHPPKLEPLERGYLLILNVARESDGAPLARAAFSLLFDGELCVLLWPEGVWAAAKPPEEGGEATARLAHDLGDGVLARVLALLDEFDEFEDRALTDVENADFGTLITLQRNFALLARLGRGNEAAVAAVRRLPPFRDDGLMADLEEHMQRVQLVGNARAEYALNLMQAMQSMLGQRLNEVMRLLTVITVVLSPLAIITGIFGMNFSRMPVLQWSWGFSLTLWGMLLLGVGLALLFRRRRWW